MTEHNNGVSLGLGLRDDNVGRAVSIFAALSSATRLRIIEMLSVRERNVGEIIETLGLLQPNASQNLSVLRNAGIVTVRGEAQTRIYSLRQPWVDPIRRMFTAIREAEKG